MPSSPSPSRRALAALLLVALHVGLAVALTWPVARDPGALLVGGGELGGWLWRQWWHFLEIEAIGAAELGPLATLTQLVGLGRYPETGNILDVLLLSWPLDQLFGFPLHHNLKVLVILLGNGLCGYALARHFTASFGVALGASVLAVCNPLVFEDVNGTGLRQVLLWFVLLYPLCLERALVSRTARSGLLAGLCFALAAVFYWFYGIFAALHTVVRLAFLVGEERPAPRLHLRWVAAAALTAAPLLLLFLLPYLSGGGSLKLPETTFLLPFPSYDTVAAAPLRPQNYMENIWASLHRVIDSSWTADAPFDPRHGLRAWPVAATLVGVAPALFVRRARVWLAIWVLFWLGTMGPFLKVGPWKDTADVVRFGDAVVRMPWTWMFQFIPGLSRLFAPYRFAAFMVVALVALVAIVLDRLPQRARGVAGLMVGLLAALQPFAVIPKPDHRQQGGPSLIVKVPLQSGRFDVPAWYLGLEPGVREGVVELPLEQQQDLLAAWQSFHGRKVWRSWAGPAALPPLLRDGGGGAPGDTLRWLAHEDGRTGAVVDVLSSFSRDPAAAGLAHLSDQDLRQWIGRGPYRWLVVHERGYYLVDPREGGLLYRAAVQAWEARLGLGAAESVALGAAGGAEGGDPAWMPLASREVDLPRDQVPRRYRMAVFDLAAWDPGPGDPAPAAER